MFFFSLMHFGLFPSAMWWTWAWSTSCTAVSCPYKDRLTRVPRWLPISSKPQLFSMGCASCVLLWLVGEWFLMLLHLSPLSYSLWNTPPVCLQKSSMAYTRTSLQYFGILWIAVELLVTIVDILYYRVLKIQSYYNHCTIIHPHYLFIVVAPFPNIPKTCR